MYFRTPFACNKPESASEGHCKDMYFRTPFACASGLLAREVRSSDPAPVVLNDKDLATTPARELGAILANLPGRTDHERLSLAGGSPSTITSESGGSVERSLPPFGFTGHRLLATGHYSLRSCDRQATGRASSVSTTSVDRRGPPTMPDAEMGIHSLRAGAATGLEKSEKRRVQAARNGPSLPPCVAKAEIRRADRLGSREVVTRSCGCTCYDWTTTRT